MPKPEPLSDEWFLSIVDSADFLSDDLSDRVPHVREAVAEALEYIMANCDLCEEGVMGVSFMKLRRMAEEVRK